MTEAPETNAGSNAVAKVETTKPLSVAQAVGQRYSMEAEALLTVLANTVFPKHKDGSPPSKSELTAFLAICYEHQMNPFTREIFAYVAKSGNIETIISVDGWLRKMNEHPAYDGMDFDETTDEKGKPVTITATLYRKDRRPMKITEHYVECYRNTDPWNGMPHRMMRNKVIRQVARVGFGFAAVVDEDYLDEKPVHVGSGMSESLQKATESKAEALKEKIGAKKLQAVAPKNPEPEKTTLAASESEAKESRQEAALTPISAANGETATESGSVPPDEPGSAGPDPEAKISKTDRENFVKILMGKKCDQQVVVDATKKKLQEMNYKKTEEILNKDLPAMVEWAEKWAPPENVNSL